MGRTSGREREENILLGGGGGGGGDGALNGKMGNAKCCH